MRGSSPHPVEVPQPVAQPALVRRMRSHHLLTRIGLVVSLLALVAAVGLSFTFTRWNPSAAWWPVVALVCGGVMVVICALQAWVWRQALAEWTGRRDVNLSAFVEPSRLAHLVSYAVALGGLLSAVAMLLDAGPQPTMAAAAVAYVVLLVVAQRTAGIEDLQVAGPAVVSGR